MMERTHQSVVISFQAGKVGEINRWIGRGRCYSLHGGRCIKLPSWARGDPLTLTTVEKRQVKCSIIQEFLKIMDRGLMTPSM